MIELAENNTAGFAPSMLVVYGVGVFFLGTLLWLTLAQVARNRMRAKLAAALNVQDARPLEEGPAIIRGRVELEDPEASDGVPVRIAVHQKGKQTQTKSGLQHQWVETHRTLSYRPFYLRLATGDRIRVVPNARVMLADELDNEERSPDDPTQRARIAELRVGEEVIASGVLKREKAIAGEGAGYRGGGTTLVMRAPPQQKLLLSTAPLEQRFQHCARHYRWVATLLAVFMLVTHVVAFGSFHLMNAKGQVVEATDITTRLFVTSHKNTDTWHYQVSGWGTDGEKLEVEVSEAQYAYANNATRLPFLVVPGYPKIYTIGLHPRAGIVRLIGFVIAVGIGLLAYRYAPYFTSRLPWYERRRVVDSGHGPL